MEKFALVFTGTSSSGKSTLARLASKEYDLPIFAVGGFTRDLAKKSGYLDVVEFERTLGVQKAYYDTIPKMLDSIREFSANRSIILEGIYDPNLYRQISTIFDNNIFLITVTSSRHLRINFTQKKLGVGRREAEKSLRHLEHQKKIIGRDEFCKNYDIKIRNAGNLDESFQMLKTGINGLLRKTQIVYTLK